MAEYPPGEDGFHPRTAALFPVKAVVVIVGLTGPLIDQPDSPLSKLPLEIRLGTGGRITPGKLISLKTSIEFSGGNSPKFELPLMVMV
jgi:hypothetical protein